MSLLNIKECLQRPFNSFIKGILDPLKKLRQRGQIENQDIIILVDSLCDAEYHKPDHGDTITSFISRVLPHSPTWIKWVVTVKSSHKDLLNGIPLSTLNLWQEVSTKQEMNQGANNNDEIPKHNTDLLEYATYRAHVSNELKANICVGSNAPDPNLQKKFFHHLISQAKGNFLYCKLVLDLIENGCLVLKTSNFKILPMNLHEVLLLNFNLKFPR